LRIGIFGGALDTGNLGVSALGAATAFGLARAGGSPELTLFDHGGGARFAELRDASTSVRVRLLGCAHSRRLWRPGNLAAMHAALRLGLRRLQPMLRELSRLDAICDISGGDSFAELYGEWRFRAVTLPKRIALDLGRPLVLLPQTYGPFRAPGARALAAEILRGARQAWSREARSLEVVRELLGADFDPARHRAGVDVAFGLPATEPADAAARERVLAFRKRFETVAGLNVSGLLYHDPDGTRWGFGLREPYRAVIDAILERLLALPDAGVLLVPHVVPPCSAEESDVDACERLRRDLAGAAAERVLVAPAFGDPCQAKWVVGRTDWFCGTRMHACIAALSQGVPTLGLAYSDKALGVFETADAGDALFDARRLGAREIAERVETSLRGRAESAAALARARPRLDSALSQQFDAMLRALGG
jgi:polysaccharide pyruvyl transferase WcaK-like protein